MPGEFPCFKQINVFRCQYRDFEARLAEIMGIDKFEILESPNDTVHSFSVGNEKHINYDEWAAAYKEVYEKAKNYKSDWYWNIGNILRHLYLEGKLVAGDYEIEVSW